MTQTRAVISRLSNDIEKPLSHSLTCLLTHTSAFYLGILIQPGPKPYNIERGIKKFVAPHLAIPDLKLYLQSVGQAIDPNWQRMEQTAHLLTE